MKVHPPDGTFYCFPDFSAYMKDSQKLANMLLEKVRVVTVPGKEFGFEGHLRLSYCGTIREITEGLDRIKWALDPQLGERTLSGRSQARQGVGMNIYLDVQSPAVKEAGKLASVYGLQNHGLVNLRRVYWNLPTPALYEESIFRSECSPLAPGTL